MASQAPPPVANSGEDAITRTVDIEPEAFASELVSLEEAYEVDMTLDEIDKGGYERVRADSVVDGRREEED
jgi:diphthamide biosynthesis protein 2